ncbi:putative dehydrogenase/reductase [Rhypophila decipiens]|uniref:Dehydrogenase/reductase n=1 Tax=Rhypophila decipiens TaxID=261697 RepID=A0AAN6XZ99_9PEZI|nr:putative dehydrogenase/reductase [Rhypophila decipiens]
MSASIPRQVLAIIGTGGMGLATARRLAAGRTIFLADASESNLALAAQSLKSDGHSHIHTQVVDVADYESVRKFASASAGNSPHGVVETVVHTAGLSPAMAPANRILQVDLLGTVNVIEAFEEFVGVGSSVTCIASIARFGATGLLTPEMEAFFGNAKREELDTLSEGVGEGIKKLVGENPALAYSVSKAANILRVQAAARRYAERGARINSVSPGVILTEMVRKEMAGPSRAAIQGMIDGMPMKRGGAADEIAAAVAFLASRDASYVTGADLVVDGGFTAGSQGAMSQAMNGQGKE